jgi:hypothetical protein
MDGTMARKRIKPEEIVAQPRQVDVSTGHGKWMPEAIEPRIPNVRKGSYFRGFLEPRRQAAVIQEAYIPTGEGWL